MGNKKISELNLLTTPQLSTIIPVVEGGETQKLAVGSILNSVLPISASTIVASSITVNGTITANNIVSQAIDYYTGSTNHGTHPEDNHTYTGSVLISGSETITGDLTVSGNLFIRYQTELGGNIVPHSPRGATLGTLERPFSDIFVSSGSINIAGIPGDPNTTLSNVGGNILVSAGGIRLVEPGNSFIAVTGSFQYLSGSFTHIGAQFNEGDIVTTGSLQVSGSTVMIGNNTMTGSLRISGSGFINNRRVLTDLDSGSFATTGSNRFNGNQTITGSLTLSSGSALNINDGFYVNGNKQFNYGAFYDTRTQSGSANVSHSIQFNSTDYSAGVTISNNTRIVLANVGIYNIQFSAQLDRITTTGVDKIDIWFRKQGLDIPNTNTSVTISGNANTAKIVASWNIYLQLNAGEYVQLMYSVTDLQIKILAQAENLIVPHPATPSVIVTIEKIN